MEITQAGVVARHALSTMALLPELAAGGEILVPHGYKLHYLLHTASMSGNRYTIVQVSQARK